MFEKIKNIGKEVPSRVNKQKEIQTMAEEAILSRVLDNVIQGSVILPKSRLISPELSDEEYIKTERIEKRISKFEFDIDQSVLRETGHRRAKKEQEIYEVDQSCIRDMGSRRVTY